MITARDRFFMRLTPEDVLKAIEVGTDVEFKIDYDLSLRFTNLELLDLYLEMNGQKNI